MNPLEKLFNSLDEINEQLANKIDDYLIGSFTNDARERISQEMAMLKSKKEIIEHKIKRAQQFFTDFAEKRKRADLPKKLQERYKYFFRILEEHAFQYSHDGRCAYCGRASTSRTGIVFTLDPLSNELEDICANCYIERKNQKQ